MVTNANAKQTARDQLNAMVAAFLANGGKVRRVKSGQRALARGWAIE